MSGISASTPTSRPTAFTEDAPATFAAANQYDETESLEFNLWASGAIVKDKLFFFALYNPRDITDFDCASGSCTEEANDSPFYALKLDFVPWEGHRAEYTFFSDDQTRDVSTWRYSEQAYCHGDADAVASTPLSDFQNERVSASKYVNGGENHIFRYTAALTDWMTLSALWGENNTSVPTIRTTDTPWTSSLSIPSPGRTAPSTISATGRSTCGRSARTSARTCDSTPTSTSTWSAITTSASAGTRKT